jgi:hypothetical protein
LNEQALQIEEEMAKIQEELDYFDQGQANQRLQKQMESPSATKLESRVNNFSDSTGIDKKNSIFILMGITGILLFVCGCSIAMVLLKQIKKKEPSDIITS